MVPESIRKDPELLWSRRLIWVYFWLLLFEGALTKWVLPAFAGQLGLVRDGIVAFIYLLLASRHRFPKSGFIFSSALLALLLAIGAQIGGHKDWMVTLNGLRVNFLHLPLIFVIPELFSLDDVKLFGRCLLWISIPFSVLVVWQLLSPVGDPINAAVGALKEVRPTGVFSSVSGVICFLSFQAAFIAGAFLEGVDAVLCLISLIALALSLLCGLSLGAMAACTIVLGVFIWGLLINPQPVKRGLIFLLIVGVVAVAASFTPLYKMTESVVELRSAKGGNRALPLELSSEVWQKLRNNLADPLDVIKVVSMTGAGTGTFTAFGASRLSGRKDFHMGGNEWSRLLLESGLVLGIALILLRVSLAGYLIYWGVRAMKKSDNFLPWMLCSVVFPLILGGAWDQPSILGFGCFGGGLILAATRQSYEAHPLFKHAYSSLRR